MQNPEPDIQDQQMHMTCMEVWGGSHITEQSVELGDLDAWIYSKPFGEAQSGGDVYYVSSCATGRISRILLADVAGHGHSVADTAMGLRNLMRRFVNHLDQTEFVRLLNQQFIELPRESVFATAVVTTYFAPTGLLSVCNAGHPRPLLFRSAQRKWELVGSHDPSAPLTNMPLGILDITQYEQFEIQLEPGDYFLSYSDALIECTDDNDEMLKETGLLRMAQRFADLPPAQMISALLKEIGEQYPGKLHEDDVTLLLLQANGNQPRVSMSEKLTALGRFTKSLVQAIDPSAERPPFPDATLANLGGAILPALNRRWSGIPKPDVAASAGTLK